MALAATQSLARSTHAATLQQQVEYGGSGAVMNLYVPDSVDAVPAVLVSLHYCGGNAQDAAGWFTAALGVASVRRRHQEVEA